MQQPLQKGARIVIVGTAGMGKTYLSLQIAANLQIPCVDLEALRRLPDISHWNPNAIKIPDDVFLPRVEEAIRSESWVVDGGLARDWVWPRATTFVWLDYPLYIALWRILRRWIGFLLSPKTPGQFKFHQLVQFFSRHSVIPWCISVHRRYRRLLPALLKDPQFAHLTVARLTSPRQTQQWLSDWLKSLPERVEGSK